MKAAQTREWAMGYKAGKHRARIEVLVVVMVIYFGIAIIGRVYG